MRRVVVCMMLASTMAGRAANVLRKTTGRARPHAKNVEVGWHGPIYHGKLTLGQNKLGSFPSGHTATAVGFFGYLLLLRMPASLIGALLIWIVPAARIVSGAQLPLRRGGRTRSRAPGRTLCASHLRNQMSRFAGRRRKPMGRPKESLRRLACKLTVKSSRTTSARRYRRASPAGFSRPLTPLYFRSVPRARSARNDSHASRMPSSIPMRWHHPVERMSETSHSLRGVPSGFVRSNTMRP